MARVTVLLVLVLVSVVNCQKCDFINDVNSPFYWAGEENVCSEKLCREYPELHCELPPDYIPDQVSSHYPENITLEVMYLQQYFDTLVPPPLYPKDYNCKGICEHPPQLIERIFTDLDVPDDYTGIMTKKRWMCHVIGPKIYRRQCGGKCDVLYGTTNAFCVPDFTVSIDVWVFCEGVYPGCRKIKLDVPISCSCKEFYCKSKPPQFVPRPPRLPDWAQLGPILPGQMSPAVDISPVNIDMSQMGVANPVNVGNPGQQNIPTQAGINVPIKPVQGVPVVPIGPGNSAGTVQQVGPNPVNQGQNPQGSIDIASQLGPLNPSNWK